MKEYHHPEDKANLQELLQQFDNLKNGKPNSFLDEDSFEKIINHFEEEDDLSQAMEATLLGIEQYPYSAALLVHKADLLLTRRQYRKALQVLDQAALFDGGDINIYILKTEAYLALDEQEKAVTILHEALELFEGEERLELLFELCDVYDDYEEFDKVFDCLKMILEQEPNNEEALYKVCFWTDFTGRNEESIRLHTGIIDEYPYNELAWFNLATAYQGLKLYEKAIDAYQYALAIDEKFDYAYRNMGDAYIRLRKYKEAIESLMKVTELSKPEAVIYEAIGHCHDRLGKYAQARLYYRKASHLSPDDSKLFYKIACTYFNEEQWESAVRQLHNALKIQKQQSEYNLLMGECKLKLGLIKEAVQYFSAVVRNKPKYLKGWEGLIRCLYNAEFYEEALEQVDTVLDISERKPVFLYYKAAVLLGLGRSKEAALQLGNALSAAPKMLKKFIELSPHSLQNQQVVDVIAAFKRNKSL